MAVKFVRGTDPQEAERLLLEARLQARVDIPSPGARRMGTAGSPGPALTRAS